MFKEELLNHVNRLQNQLSDIKGMIDANNYQQELPFKKRIIIEECIYDAVNAIAKAITPDPFEALLS